MIDFENADRNKSVFKLKGIGPIYYINMDDQPEGRSVHGISI